MDSDDPHAKKNIAPYVGIGIGAGNAQTSIEIQTKAGSTTQTTNNDTKTILLAQGIIGVNYFIDDFSYIGVEYRYVATGSTSTLGSALTSHNINLTMNFSFGGSSTNKFGF